MHPIVPIIMALGAISFFTGLTVLARLGMQRIKEVNVFGKVYTLWRFTFITIGVGIILIMLSVLIHQNVPYTPEIEAPKSQLVQSGTSDYELGLILSGIEGNVIDDYLTQFRMEYHEALNKGDKNTTELLLLELQFRMRTELEKHGLEPAQIDEKINSIMSLLQLDQKR